VLLIKAMFVVGLHELQVLRKAKWSSVTYDALAGQQLQLLRHCFNVMMPCGQMINLDLYSQTLKICQKHFRLGSSSQKCWWNPPPTWKCFNRHKFENTRSSHKTQMNCYSPPAIQPRCAPSDFLFFGDLRGAVRGKRFGDDDMFTEEVTRWLQVQNWKCYKKGIDAVVIGTRLLKLMDNM
jgi:hypothetical protein